MFSPRNRLRASHRQQGAALLIMLVIMVLGTAAFLVSSLSRVGQSLRSDQATVEALNQAKEALIAYAINGENRNVATGRPGDLPCPDTNAPGAFGYGAEQGTCSAGAIGRLPWITLGIPELFDSDGEPLWYSVSGNFRRDVGGGPSVLNSDTAGALDVYANDGTTLLTSSVDKAVAVVFAPGRKVGSQVRNTNTQKITAANYLETANSRNNAIPGGPFISANASATFNDKLVYIKESQFIPAIEKRVAGELKKLLNTYYTAWHAFPFAVPFATPSTATYTGSSGTYYGLAPVDSLLGGSANQPDWNAVPSIAFSDSVTRLYCALSSGSWTNSRWRCCTVSSACSSSTNTTIPAGVTVTITGKLNHVGLGFWRPHDITNTSEVRVRDSFGNTALASSVFGSSVSVTGTLNYADGGATVVFSATGQLGGSTLQRIELRDIVDYSSIVPNWFSNNRWQRVMYYATSSDFAPNGGQTCSGACLTLDNKTVRAVVIATGSPLSSQTHPSGTLSDYLEGTNAAPASGIFQNRTNASTFNDQVISVAP